MFDVYEFILFDLDGTLTDPKMGIICSINYALRECSLPEVGESKDNSWMIGPPLRDDFKQILGDKAEDGLVERLVGAYRKRFETIGIFENSLYPGIENLLSRISRAEGKNRKLAIATTKPTIFAEKILKHFSIDHLFDFVSGSELDGKRSSKEELIRSVVEHFRITDLSSCLMIGDRKHDIEGARQVGIDSVGVLYGYGTKTEIENSNPNYVVCSVDELAELLGKI